MRSSAVFDADSHLMEVEEWLPAYADPQVRDRLRPLGFDKAGAGAAELMLSLPELWAQQRDEGVTADVISGPKGWKAPGALDAAVRTRVLDALGISAQLVFPTFSLSQFTGNDDLELLYGGTRALNRAMVDFCSHDPRLNPVG